MPWLRFCLQIHQLDMISAVKLNNRHGSDFSLHIYFTWRLSEIAFFLLIVTCLFTLVLNKNYFNLLGFYYIFMFLFTRSSWIRIITPNNNQTSSNTNKTFLFLHRCQSVASVTSICGRLWPQLCFRTVQPPELLDPCRLSHFIVCNLSWLVSLLCIFVRLTITSVVSEQNLYYEGFVDLQFSVTSKKFRT